MIPLEHMQYLGRAIRLDTGELRNPMLKEPIIFSLYKYNCTVVEVIDLHSHPELKIGIFTHNLAFSSPYLQHEATDEVCKLPWADIPCSICPSLGPLARLREHWNLIESCQAILVSIEDSWQLRSRLCMIGFPFSLQTGDKLSLTYLVDSKGRQTLGYIRDWRGAKQTMAFLPYDFLSEGYGIFKTSLIGRFLEGGWRGATKSCTTYPIGFVIMVPILLLITGFVAVARLPIYIAKRPMNRLIEGWEVEINRALESSSEDV
jgi:hypothetical protein